MTIDLKNFTVGRQEDYLVCTHHPSCGDRWIKVVDVDHVGNSHRTLHDYVTAAQNHVDQVEHVDLKQKK